MLIKVLEDTFISGQESGRFAMTRIKMYNQKKCIDREKHLTDLRYDAINMLIDELKASLPCGRNSQCKLKLSVQGYIDRFGDGLIEKIDAKVKEMENGFEQGKLF